jgi:hypothetical protein
VVISLDAAKKARQDGVFAAVNIAARGMGYSDHLALLAARRARDEFKAGGKSAAKVVSEVRAELRHSAEGLLA